jgi:hypothetical protein
MRNSCSKRKRKSKRERGPLTLSLACKKLYQFSFPFCRDSYPVKALLLASTPHLLHCLDFAIYTVHIQRIDGYGIAQHRASDISYRWNKIGRKPCSLIRTVNLFICYRWNKKERYPAP